MQQAGANRRIRHSIDQDETTEIAVLLVGLEHDRSIELQIADADVVQLQRLGREVLERVDVHLVLERSDGGGAWSASRFSSGTIAREASARRASKPRSLRIDRRRQVAPSALASTSPRLTSMSSCQGDRDRLSRRRGRNRSCRRPISGRHGSGGRRQHSQRVADVDRAAGDDIRRSRGSRDSAGSPIARQVGTASICRSSPTGTCSRCSISVGPVYQGMCGPCWTTLSPCTADIGNARDVGHADLGGELAVLARRSARRRPASTSPDPSC